MPADVPDLSADLSGDLSADEREILAFEGDWTAHVGTKDTQVRERFGLEPADYHRLLGRLIDRPDAELHAPRLVRRLRRQRAARQEQRAARRAG